MLLVGGAVVRIYLVLRLMLQHRPNKRTANAVRSLTQLGAWQLEGVCHAPHSNLSSNEEPDVRVSEASDDVSPLCNGCLCAGACEKIVRAFAQSVGLLTKIILTSDVCARVRIEVCPSHATKAPSTSIAATSVEARYLHLHPPLLAYKAVLSLWSWSW